MSTGAQGVEASIRDIASEQWAALGGDGGYLDADLRQGFDQLGEIRLAEVGRAGLS